MKELPKFISAHKPDVMSYAPEEILKIKSYTWKELDQGCQVLGAEKCPTLF